MEQIVECVANISEGQNAAIIAIIADAIRSSPETKLLHIDAGANANRTVFTFVGSLASLRHSVLQMYAKALQHIDMSKQSGTHPRIGAVDVCPFIPISGIEMSELVAWVNQLAKDISEQYAVPVYLYEKSAKIHSRKNLATIRKGEYENLSEKFSNESWNPDYGPTDRWEKTGATVIGARKFLLAYNINLETKDVNTAKKIAKEIRGSGYLSSIGERIPGLFPSVKAIGWYIKEYGCTQVSTNLTDFKSCSLHQVYEACRNIATKHNTTVMGSELIGLTPLEPLIKAGKFYSGKSMPETEFVHIACTQLGLSSISDFLPEERVIEYLL